MHIHAALDVDVVALEEDDSVTVMLDLTAAKPAVRTERPPNAAIVVLDRSGSMSGRRLSAARSALIALVDRLDDKDYFGLVTFDSSAQVSVATETIGRLGRNETKHRIAAVMPGGSTDLASGYLRGIQEAQRVATGSGATILVLSDGHANTGIIDPQAFRQMAAGAAAQRITSSTIGIGLGYDEQILTELAIGGNGNNSFAEEADAAAVAVAAELDGLLSKAVQATSLLITPTCDVVSVSVLNDLPSQGMADGVMVDLGDFYAGEQRRLLVTLGVPAMAALGLAQVAELRLTYFSVPDLQSHTVTVPVSVNVVPEDLAKGRIPDPIVTREKLLLDVQSSKRTSEEALRRGDVATARLQLGATLNRLTEALADAPDVTLDEEISFLTDSLADLEIRETTYLSKRLSTDRSKKSRGYRDRAQGGQWRTDGEPS